MSGRLFDARVRLLLMAMATGVALTLGAGPAYADPWAVVLADNGDLSASDGVESSVRLGVGSYLVKFKKKTVKSGEQKCVPLATVINAPGQISTIIDLNTGDVRINTRNSAGVLSNLSFYLALIC